MSSARSALLVYLLLSTVYLLYAPDAAFVLDDWYMFQRFEQAQAEGSAAEWRLAGQLMRNEFLGLFRLYWLSFISVFGLYQLAGLRPLLYFLCGLLLHAVVAWLWRGVLDRLGFDPRLSFLAGALLVVLPTARNPLFWFPSCAHYVLGALWFLIYLRLVAESVVSGGGRPWRFLWQGAAGVAALFSTDQVFGLLVFGALWVALLWRSRAGVVCAVVIWVALVVAGGAYLRLSGVPPPAGSVAIKFRFDSAQARQNLENQMIDYRKLGGIDEGFYRVSGIGWGALAALGAGVAVWWRLRSATPAGAAPLVRAFLLGAGFCAAGYAPVWFLRWRDLRYDYLPSLGLALMFAAACLALARLLPRPVFPIAGGLLVAGCAASAVAEIEQCWQPQSRDQRALQAQLRRLPDLRDHDVVVISGAPLQIGTAPHFAMVGSHISRPFVEMTTGVGRLSVGRALFCDSGQLGLEHAEYLHAMPREEVRRTHVLVADGRAGYRPRSLLACQMRPDAWRLLPLKSYQGAPIPDREFTRSELAPREAEIYFAPRHHH